MGNQLNLKTSKNSAGSGLEPQVAFPAGVREVAVLRDGARRIIVPANAIWDDFFEAEGIDLGDRSQPAAQARETF